MICSDEAMEDITVSREKFTPRQMDLLKKNEYTYEVTESQIFFTKAFKEKFWAMYQGGMTPRQIVTELGYDPDILGTKRLSGIQLTIKKQANRPGGFTEGKGHRRTLESAMEGIEENPDRETIVRMQHEILFLRQEMEFLKKISSIRNTEK